MEKTALISTFKIVGFLEGLSYILLLFVGVPMKYVFDNEIFVKALGMPHGILFIAYVLFALVLSRKLKWSLKTTFIILLASIIPFGTLYVNRKILKPS